MTDPRPSNYSRAWRNKLVRRALLLEGLANLIVLSIKVVVGMLTGSAAIIADALHSFTDLANNVIAWVVIRASEKPPDKKHPYGHRKFESLAVFVLATLLLVVSIELVLHALRRETQEVSSGRITIALMLGVLVVNLAIALWQSGQARKLSSDILHADASHTAADALVTLIAILGWQLSSAGYYWIDSVAAIVVATLVGILSFRLFLRALPTLVDERAIDERLIEKCVREVHGVRHVYQIRSRWIGNDRAIDMSVVVNPALSTKDAHSIADRIEHHINQEFEITDVVIHIEPFAPETSEKRPEPEAKNGNIRDSHKN